MKKTKWLILFTAALLILIILKMQAFLAYNSPVDGEILVVEGWCPGYVLNQAVSKFHKGNYQYLVTIGGPVSDPSKHGGCSNYADFAAKEFIKLGVEKNSLIAVPAPHVKRHHTYSYVLAFRKWLINSDLNVKALNVFSFNLHARKTYIIFKKVLGPEMQIGIIAGKTNDYDPKFWWLSVNGIKLVFRYSIEYTYALCRPF